MTDSTSTDTEAVLDRAHFGADGLLPAIVQEESSKDVLMLGYMDRAALDATIADRLVTFHSRSRGASWRKGETSGNLLDLVDIRFDCDRDALLILAHPRGPTCHTGSVSCFGDAGAPPLHPPAVVDARWLEDRFAAVRARNFAMVQRRGVDVWAWAGEERGRGCK